MELFLSLNGRIGRGKWWMATIILTIIILVLTFAMMAIFSDSLMANLDPVTGMPPIGTLLLIYIPSLLSIWPSICISGKRYHDRNKSAWWLMIAFIPLIGAIWMIIELGFLRGTEGSNDYGSDPLA